MGRPKGSKNTVTSKGKLNSNPMLQNTGSPAPINADPSLSSDLQAIKTGMEAEKEERSLGIKTPRRTQKRLLEEQEQQEAIRKSAEVFSVGGNLLLKFLAKRLPNPIPPTEEELEAFDQAVTGVVMKYLPTMGNWKEEIILGTVLIGIGLPRFIREKNNDQDQIIADYKAELEKLKNDKPE